MHRIRLVIRRSPLFVLIGLLAACGQQPPAPVVFDYRPVTPSPAGQSVAQQPAPQTPQQSAYPIPDIVVAPETTSSTVEVQPGDTVYALSRRYNRPVRAIIDENNLQPPYLLQPGQRITIPGGRFHTVQPGDTLYSISRAYDVDLYTIAQDNNLTPPYTIAVGQRLRIPSTTAYAVASATPGLGTASSANTATGSRIGSSRGVDVETLPPPPSAGTSQPPSSAPAVSPKPQQTAPQQPAPVPEVAVPEVTAPSSSAPKAETPPAQQEATAPVPIPEERPAQHPAPQAEPPRQEAAVVPPRAGRTFSWPVRGRILSSFGPKADGLHNDGINIAARAGSPVLAAENGIVVYAGNELRGFGNLLLVRHADGWITAYAHLDKMLVKKGQKVTRGQAIGTVGSTGGVSQPQLHFEIRKGTQAVDPTKFLSVA